MAVTALDVVIVAESAALVLIDYRYKHHFKAERGTHGRVLVAAALTDTCRAAGTVGARLDQSLKTSTRLPILLRASK